MDTKVGHGLALPDVGTITEELALDWLPAAVSTKSMSLCNRVSLGRAEKTALLPAIGLRGGRAAPRFDAPGLPPSRGGSPAFSVRWNQMWRGGKKRRSCSPV